MNSIETKGEKPLVKDLSIRIDFHEKSFSLHLWRPDPKSYGRTKYRRPEKGGDA